MKCKWLLILLATMLLMPAPWATGKENLTANLGGKLVRMNSHDLMNKGLGYVNRDMPDSAMICFTIVANRRFTVNKKDTSELKECARALNDIGVLYYNYYYDFPKSYDYYTRALALAEAHQLKEPLAPIYNNLAVFDILQDLLHTGHFSGDSVFSKSKKALNIGLSMNDENIHLEPIITNLVTRAIESDKVSTIKGELNRYLAYTQSDTTKEAIAARHLCLLAFEYDKKHYESALSHIEQAIALKNSDSHKFIKYLLLYQSGQIDEALQYMHHEELLAKKANKQLELFDIYDILLNHYRKANNEPLAEKYELLYLRQKDSILYNGRVVDMTEQRFLAQIEQANLQAEQIARESKITKRVLWIALLFMSLLACMTLLLYRKYRQVQERNEILYKKNVQLLAVEDQQRTNQPKYQKNNMNEDSKAMLLERIIGVMETSKEIFTDNFSLDRLAEMTGANANLVSRVINELRGCNFNALLSEYRIKEACRRMNDVEHYGNQTVEAIAASVGFRSRSHFSTNFKRQTGLTPSAYQRLAKNPPNIDSPQKM